MSKHEWMAHALFRVMATEQIMRTNMENSKTTKRQRALEAMKIAEDAGCYPTIEGNFVVWRPCLPANMLGVVMGHGDEIIKILEERNVR